MQSKCYISPNSNITKNDILKFKEIIECKMKNVIGIYCVYQYKSILQDAMEEIRNTPQMWVCNVKDIKNIKQEILKRRKFMYGENKIIRALINGLKLLIYEIEKSL